VIRRVALPQLFAATAPEARPAHQYGPTQRRRLWEVSEELVAGRDPVAAQPSGRSRLGPAGPEPSEWSRFVPLCPHLGLDPEEIGAA